MASFLVTAKHLRCLRAAAAATLPDTGEIKARTIYSDGRGGNTESWPTEATTRCRVQRLKEPVEVLAGNKQTVVCGFKAWFPQDLDADLSGEKRLTVNGATYDIIGGVQGASEELFAVAFCNRVEGE